MRYSSGLSIYIVLLALFLVAGIYKTSAYAQPASGCDPQIMDSMEAKAWLHAQRRISQNANFIYKPDSVLEYSCFNQFIGYLADNPARRFSEEINYALWQPPPASISVISTDSALYEVVTAPLIEYLNGNFGHTFLGDHLPSGGGAPPPYGTYNCDAMSVVWGAARCSNFMENSNLDGFYDFAYYSANDPRGFPAPACTPDGRILAALDEAYRGADTQTGSVHGNEAQHYALAVENDPFDDGVPYDEDPMLSLPILQKMIAGNCTNSGIIPTGITIDYREGSTPALGASPGTSATTRTVLEHVCTIPACSYGSSACQLTPP